MMLARSFLSAKELNISEPERTAMIQVLGMMERGELQHDPTKVNGRIENYFDMGQASYSCGTPSCIGGYVAAFMGGTTRDELNMYVGKYMDREGSPMYDLYWSRTSSSITPDQAACALRSFLSTGNPNWDEALS